MSSRRLPNEADVQSGTTGDYRVAPDHGGRGELYNGVQDKALALFSQVVLVFMRTSS